MRLPSCARRSERKIDSTRLVVASAIARPSSTPTHTSARCRAASSPVPAAWTTASTSRLPVHAIAPGISPSSTLPTASAIVIGRLVVHTSPSARRA
jgi:hypothetical protein